MSKGLKNFVEENRRSFDEELPSGDLWHRVEKSIKTKKKGGLFFRKTFYQWAAAAALVVLAGAVCLLLIQRNSRDAATAKADKPLPEHRATKNDIGAMAPEYAATAQRISKSIEMRQQELKTMAAEVPELYNQFAGDLAALDSSYKVLKNRASQSPGREEIIKAMLQNLQLQAELLGKQLLIINEFKNNKTDKNEKADSRPL